MSRRDVARTPSPGDDVDAAAALVAAEVQEWGSLWQTLAARLDEGTLQLPAAGRAIAVTGDVAWRAGRLVEAHLQLVQSDAGLRAAAVVGPADAAARDGRIRANLTGETDLAPTLALAGEILTGLGRSAQVD